MRRYIDAIEPDLIRISRKRHPARRNFPYSAPNQGSAIALLARWKCPSQSSEWLRTASPVAHQKCIPSLLLSWLRRCRRCIEHGRRSYSHRRELRPIAVLRDRHRKGEYFEENAPPAVP